MADAQPTITAAPDSAPKADETKLKERVLSGLMDILAPLLWAYVIIKLFVFDVDNYLIARFVPQFEPFLRFKFFFIIGAIAILLATFRSKWVAGAVAFVVF